jgi:hypothetical protein
LYYIGIMADKFKIKLSQLQQLNDDQRQMIHTIFDLLQSGKNIKRSDLQTVIDFTRLTNTEMCDVSKLARNQLAEICAKDPTIKNSDGSYSLVNLIQYLRGKGSTALSEGSIEEKRKVETQILEKKLADLQGQYTLNTDVEKMLADRLDRLLTCLGNEPLANAYLYEQKTTDEARDLLNAFIRRAMTEYRDSFAAVPDADTN